MRYHIEHASVRFSGITVTGWLAGPLADTPTRVWVEDGQGQRRPAEVIRSEREDVREALFPQETQCLFGFRVKCQAEESAAWHLCLSDGQETVRRKIDLTAVRKYGRLLDDKKEELKAALPGRAKEALAAVTGYADTSPYTDAFGEETHKAVKGKKGGVSSSAPSPDSAPLFSVLVPLYETDREHLAQMLSSVLEQTFSSFEVCLADASRSPIRESCAHQTDPVSRAVTQALSDPRVHYQALPENGGISANSNAALQMVTGQYEVMEEHGARLSADALAAAAGVLERLPETDFLYSDSDLTDHDGLYTYSPLFKPGWSPEMLLSSNYITHLSIVRTALLRSLGGWRPVCDGAQDWDLFFRIGENTGHIVRIPQVLYHWRAAQSSTASGVEAKPYAKAAQKRAVQDHLVRLGLSARVDFVSRESTCLRAELSEVGDVILRTAPGVTIREEDARELKTWASVPGVGIAAPRIVNGKGQIVSQGLILKAGGPQALSAGRYPGTADTLGNTDWYENPGAVEPLCYCIPRKAWDEVGEVDSSLGDLALVDYCLRLQRAGYRCVVTPFAEVCGEESIAKSLSGPRKKEYEKLLQSFCRKESS